MAKLRNLYGLVCWITISAAILNSQDGGALSKRVALVVGNSHYSYTDSLRDAGKDAQQMAAVLKSVGFDVTLKQDLSRDEMVASLEELQVKATGSKEVVFYYSGHAFQKSSKNYLAPVDTHINHLESIDHEAVSLDSVLASMAHVQGSKVVLLDSCRSQFPGLVPGLARQQTQLPDILISFSTSPDHVADDGDGVHSPFTRALLKMIVQPGLTIEECMRQVRLIVETSTEGHQVPWDESSLTGQVYFRMPIYITAQILAADDDVTVIVNGSDLTSWGNDGNAKKKIPIHAGSNPFLVRVFNQRSYTGGPPLLGGHLPEGWKFTVVLGVDGGEVLGTFSGAEDRPEDNGPRHGKWFTTVQGVIDVDEDTSQIKLTGVDSKVWLH